MCSDMIRAFVCLKSYTPVSIMVQFSYNQPFEDTLTPSTATASAYRLMCACAAPTNKYDRHSGGCGLFRGINDEGQTGLVRDKVLIQLYPQTNYLPFCRLHGQTNVVAPMWAVSWRCPALYLVARA